MRGGLNSSSKHRGSCSLFQCDEVSQRNCWSELISIHLYILQCLPYSAKFSHLFKAGNTILYTMGVFLLFFKTTKTIIFQQFLLFVFLFSAFLLLFFLLLVFSLTILNLCIIEQGKAKTSLEKKKWNEAINSNNTHNSELNQHEKQVF